MSTRIMNLVRTGVVAGVGAALLIGPGMATAQADTPTPQPRGAVAASSIPSKFVVVPKAYGDKDYADGYLGRPVAMTQYLLRRWSPNLATDGSFGPGTREAVRKFQRAVGLRVTGRLDRADYYRLFVRQTVRYGSTGHAVRAVQSYMNQRVNGMKIDGSFGPATRAAVLKEQREHGKCGHYTGVDGVVGPFTWSMFFEGEHDSPC